MTIALLRKLPKKELLIFILSFIIVIQFYHEKETIKIAAVHYYSTIMSQFMNENFTFIAQEHSIESFLTSNLVTVHVNAGMGNQMYEIASLYGIAAHLQMKPFIQRVLLSQVVAFQKHFPSFHPILLNNISTKDIGFGSKCCSYEDVEKLRNSTRENVTLKGMYFQSHRFFDEIRPQIKEMFAFSPTALTAAQSIMENVHEEFHSRIKSQSFVPILSVCVHIRRGDFVTDPQLLETRTEFTIAAINWLRTELKGNGLEVIFILLGNDKNWAEQLLPNDLDIFVPPAPAEKIIDMALMATSCNVILLSASASSYGFWSAYLSDKAIVYYNEDYTKSKSGWIYDQFTPSDIFLRKWTPLKFNSSSTSTTTTTAISTSTSDSTTSATTTIPTSISLTSIATTFSTTPSVVAENAISSSTTPSLASSNNETASTTTTPTQLLTTITITSPKEE